MHPTVYKQTCFATGLESAVLGDEDQAQPAVNGFSGDMLGGHSAAAVNGKK